MPDASIGTDELDAAIMSRVSAAPHRTRGAVTSGGRRRSSFLRSSATPDHFTAHAFGRVPLSADCTHCLSLARVTHIAMDQQRTSTSHVPSDRGLVRRIADGGRDLVHLDGSGHRLDGLARYLALFVRQDANQSNRKQQRDPQPKP